MLSYVLLVYAALNIFCSYSLTRNRKWAILCENLPEKYLISNEKILKYLLHPPYRVPKWFFIWHIFMIALFFIILICYMFFWFGISDFITTGYALIIYLAIFVISTQIVYMFNNINQKKYINTPTKLPPIDSLFK